MILRHDMLQKTKLTTNNNLKFKLNGYNHERLQTNNQSKQNKLATKNPTKKSSHIIHEKNKGTTRHTNIVVHSI